MDELNYVLQLFHFVFWMSILYGMTYKKVNAGIDKMIDFANKVCAGDSSIDESDPYVMYLVVRESLDMSAGKVGAQCAHGAQIVLMNYYKINRMSPHLINDVEEDEPQLAEVGRNMRNMRDWLASRIRKVVLKADDREWEKLKDEFGDHCVIVTDAGFTEVPSGSETVLCTWPMRKSERPKILKRLQVL